jgi:hypothetical protein
MREFCASLLVATALGCSSSSADHSQGVSDASTSDVMQATFGGSACGQCVASACAAAVTECNSTPDCESYLACLDDCPPAADGNVAADCASACPQPTSSSGQQAASQFTQCRTTGAVASCAACGSDAAASDAASSDAGADGDILHERCASDNDAANGCAQCIREQCCEVRLTCLNDPLCLALLNCESDCLSGLPDEAGASAQPPDGGSYSCDLWCRANTNPSLSEWSQLYACTTMLCDVACGGGGACATCIGQQCESEELALSVTPDGYLFNNCFGQCATTDTVCQTQCQSDYPSVVAAFNALGTCGVQRCPSCQ